MMYGMACCTVLPALPILPSLGRWWAMFAGVVPVEIISLLLVSAVMLVAGFAFKVSAVPFHFWTPDAYEGAPTV